VCQDGSQQARRPLCEVALGARARTRADEKVNRRGAHKDGINKGTMSSSSRSMGGDERFRRSACGEAILPFSSTNASAKSGDINSRARQNWSIGRSRLKKRFVVERRSPREAL
jgi:hypothetical protein